MNNINKSLETLLGFKFPSLPQDHYIISNMAHPFDNSCQIFFVTHPDVVTREDIHLYFCSKKTGDITWVSKTPYSENPNGLMRRVDEYIFQNQVSFLYPTVITALGAVADPEPTKKYIPRNLRGELRDKALVLINLIRETDLTCDGYSSINEEIIQQLLGRVEGAGLDINQYPFSVLGSYQFTTYHVNSEYKAIPWYEHLMAFAKAEDTQGEYWVNVDDVDYTYRIKLDKESSARSYSINGDIICECVGQPTIIHFKNLFSGE